MEEKQKKQEATPEQKIEPKPKPAVKKISERPPPRTAGAV